MPLRGKSTALVEGKYPLQTVLAAAEKIVKQRTEGSIILDPLAETGFPKLHGGGEFSDEDGTYEPVQFSHFFLPSPVQNYGKDKC
jgi:hypothetical protein